METYKKFNLIYKEQIKKLIKTKEKKPYIKSNISKDIETIKK